MPILNRKSIRKDTFKCPTDYKINLLKLLNNNNLGTSVSEKKTEISRNQNLTISLETPKKKKNVNVKKITLTPEDMFDSSSPMDDSDADSVLSKEVLNRIDVKEKYMEFWNETLTPEEENELKSLTQELQAKYVEAKPKKVKKKENYASMSFYEKMSSLQESRNVGLYVYCDSCDKCRYLPDVQDPLDLPEKWYCYMNPNGRYNRCEIEEEPIDEKEEELMIFNKYNAGSIVWAKIEGYPWWPAMVEDDPDIGDYFWLEDTLEPTYYHVTFFDSTAVTRSWIKTGDLKAFRKNIDDHHAFDNKFKRRLSVAVKQAKEAAGMQLIDRLKKFGFTRRYKKPSKKTKKRKENSTENGGVKRKKRSKFDFESDSSTEDGKEMNETSDE
ncbi:zinc finger CW-type PWWP domain protein 1-like [Diorhabda carinulata]|uniref:zinc finger CW-type PWWP domain protein 1-like n=1 Tax=Diorhabda carinulata TaxID=1163345 RepID=UPI0025A1C065|nr:zinc finger CW-type PWWP domain protein 1-like [Diorhabda carinulata]